MFDWESDDTIADVLTSAVEQEGPPTLALHVAW